MQPILNSSLLDHYKCLWFNNFIYYMSIESLKNNFNKDNYINKVNVDVLKNKILKKEKKTKLQNRVILGSVIVSVGIIGYFVT